MTRRSIPDYAGARGRLAISDVAALDRRFAVQEKLDGMYCHVHLDGRGRVSAIRSRTGAEVGRELVGDLRGIRAGAPWAVLVGELEAHTEAANRIAATRGWRQVHLFDAVRGEGGRYLAREPYRVRRDALWRMQSELAVPELLHADLGADGRWRERRTGRYVEAPRDWRRFPIVAQAAPTAAGELWDRAIAGDAEGLVVVALDAPLGKANAKRKVKPVDELDATVIALGAGVARLAWAGGSFHVGRGKRELEVGDVVSVRHSGFYESAVRPRFATISRVRYDLR